MPRNLAQEPTYANPLETYHLHCDTLPKKTVQMDGQSYLWLGGTNYLGIGDHPLFQEKLKEGIAHFSQNWGSSRINNFQISVWEELEIQLAQRFGTESAALCSSGLTAGQIALQWAQRRHKTHRVNVAPKTHPALWRYPNEPFTGSLEAWNETIKGDEIIAIDGTGSPWVEAIDLSFSTELSSDNTLIVDESHRIGIKHIRLITNANLVQTASLSKAYGIPAGIILGKKWLLDEIKTDSFWVGSSPPNPAFSYACLHAKEAYEEREAHSKTLIKYFESQTQHTNLPVEKIQGYPSFCSKDTRLFEHLKSKGILVNHFSYPDVTAPPICRGSLHANLQIEDVDRIIEALLSFPK
jgi:8-amino-7-oxononanoate synthase